VPIVIVTAAEHARASAAQIGADAVLSKPFEVSLLLKVVARHVVKAANAASDTPSA
jgi:DNA-binding response OmpR family regulator